MTESDGEFEEFLRRRKPMFARAPDDPLEPPAELDRLVLRQARDAIRPDETLQMYRGPRWGVPVAIAATLLIVFSVVLRVSAVRRAPANGVSVEAIAQRVEADEKPAVRALPNNKASDAGPAAARIETPTPGQSTDNTQDKAPWRHDSKAWLAEIHRLRASGDVARADAELAEFKRQNRAYASSPDH